MDELAMTYEAATRQAEAMLAALDGWEVMARLFALVEAEEAASAPAAA